MKNTGAPIGDLDGWMQPFTRFSWRKSSSSFCSARDRGRPGAREFSPRCEINGMVPCLLQWELIKGFLGEDISEVVVLGQHHVLGGPAFLSLLCFLGQLLRWGVCSPNVVFCPLRGDECGVNRISGFWSIVGGIIIRHMNRLWNPIPGPG